jgi:hypothetical protein
MTTAPEGGEGSASRPGRSLPPGKTRYPLYRRLGGPQGWSGQVQKISPPPGFDPRTVQLVASRYCDYATWPTLYLGRTTNQSIPFGYLLHMLVYGHRVLYCLLWTLHIAVEFDAAGDKWSGCNRTKVQTFMETFFGHVHDICFIDEV